MSIKWKRLLRGLLRSWQINVGHLVLALAYLETQDQFLARHLGPEATADLLVVFGLVLYVLRTKTSDSLERRGMR